VCSFKSLIPSLVAGSAWVHRTSRDKERLQTIIKGNYNLTDALPPSLLMLCVKGCSVDITFPKNDLEATKQTVGNFEGNMLQILESDVQFELATASSVNINALGVELKLRGQPEPLVNMEEASISCSSAVCLPKTLLHHYTSHSALMDGDTVHLLVPTHLPKAYTIVNLHARNVMAGFRTTSLYAMQEVRVAERSDINKRQKRVGAQPTHSFEVTSIFLTLTPNPLTPNPFCDLRLQASAVK
jgi:hypothetical protein